MSRLTHLTPIAALGLAVLVACSDEPTAVAPPPQPTTCPPTVAASVTCYAGQGLSGAPYIIGVPPNWNGVLVVWARGATLVPVTEARVLGPGRSLMRDGGLAVAASLFRGGTPLARDAAEDSEELRQIFVRQFGKPRLTVIWGNSFGGLVAARCAERYQTFQGAIAACGLVAGTLRSFYPHVDLRMVYQHYCRNLPRPDERQYDLFLGVDPQGTLTTEELNNRVNECTGISLPAAQRSAQQRVNLANILAAVRMPEAGFLANMDGATFVLNRLVSGALGGRNPFTNMGVRYTGSTDDDGLNRDVTRYRSDAATATTVAAADDPTGRVSIPVVTLHAIDDTRAFVENESAYREAFMRAGTLANLFQAYTNQGAHCLFTVAEHLGTLQVLQDWIEKRTPPTQAALAAACEGYRAEFGGTCRFNATYQPASFDTKVYTRQP